MRLAASLIATALLGGCSRGVELTDASPQDVARAIALAAPQQPGQWRTRTQLEAMDLGPGAGPRATAAIRRQIGRSQVTTGCLSPEQAGAPGFGDLRGGSCRFERFVLRGGRLDAAMHCTRPDARLRMTQEGSYGSTAYDMRSTLRQEAPGRPATSTTIRMTGQRIGDCAR